MNTARTFDSDQNKFPAWWLLNIVQIFSAFLNTLFSFKFEMYAFKKIQ